MTKPVWTRTTTTMGGHSSLPTPGECSNSDSSGPPSLLWSPWLELGAANQILVFKLGINPELISKFSQLKICNNQVIAAFLSEQLPYYFSLFLQWISWISFTWMNSLWKIFEQPQLSSLSTFKRLPRSFWVSCHLLSHLLWSHFLGGSWPQI